MITDSETQIIELEDRLQKAMLQSNVAELDALITRTAFHQPFWTVNNESRRPGKPSIASLKIHGIDPDRSANSMP